MLALHSFVPSTELYRKNISFELRLVKDQAKLSCKFLKKHGFTTVLYTTQSLKDQLFLECNYDNIIAFTDYDLDIINRCSYVDFWPAPKLLACKSIKEPYIHVDIDLFLIENHLTSFLDLPFFTFHVEKFMTWMYSGLNRQSLLEICDLNTHSDDVYNCAVFGGTNYETIAQQIVKTLQLVNSHNHALDNLIIPIQKVTEVNKWKKAVLLEQFYLTNHIKKALGLTSVPCVVDTAHAKIHADIFRILNKKNMLHLWINKGMFHENIGIDRLVAMLDKYYF